jgi:hypothetical protein
VLGNFLSFDEGTDNADLGFAATTNPARLMKALARRLASGVASLMQTQKPTIG